MWKRVCTFIPESPKPRFLPAQMHRNVKPRFGRRTQGFDDNLGFMEAYLHFHPKPRFHPKHFFVGICQHNKNCKKLCHLRLLLVQDHLTDIMWKARPSEPVSALFYNNISHKISFKIIKKLDKKIINDKKIIKKI